MKYLLFQIYFQALYRQEIVHSHKFVLCIFQFFQPEYLTAYVIFVRIMIDGHFNPNDRAYTLVSWSLCICTKYD